MARIKTDERSLKRQEPIPEVKLPEAPVEASLAATQPHVAPGAEPKAKKARSASSKALALKAKNKEKGMERAQKLEHRKGGVEGKKEKKKRAKVLWE